jgi:hypothetical protein
MKTLFEYLYNFFFNRWTSTIIEEGSGQWRCKSILHADYSYQRKFVKYKLTNKFDQSEKIERVYLN